jgi:hypothetical protein
MASNEETKELEIGSNIRKGDLFYRYIVIVCCVIVPVSLMRFPPVKADGQRFYRCVVWTIPGSSDG